MFSRNGIFNEFFSFDVSIIQCFIELMYLGIFSQDRKTPVLNNKLLSSTIAYSELLPNGPLTPGAAIIIKGVVLKKCTSFSVNLVSSSADNSDIVFHFNPRLCQRYVVRNSRHKGVWGDEETTTLGLIHLEQEKPFEIMILGTAIEYLVALNGEHFCKFEYRLPLNFARRLEICGSVAVDSVSAKNITQYPKDPELCYGLTVPLEQTTLSNNKVEVPLTAKLPNGFPLDCQLEIHGRIKLFPHSLTINLQDGPLIWPLPQIYLHINPRFRFQTNDHLAEHIIVYNSWLDKGWGREQRHICSQIKPNSSFILQVLRCAQHFSVMVNNSIIAEFKFRGNVNTINTVYIEGDLVVESIFMHKTSSA